MLYQFKFKEIKNCIECPLHRLDVPNNALSSHTHVCNHENKVLLYTYHRINKIEVPKWCPLNEVK